MFATIHVRENVIPFKRYMLKGPCDSCDRVTELFQLPGRKDKNCSECDSDISTMTLLYKTLNDAERLGMDGSKLESEVIAILLRYLERCGMDHLDHAASRPN